MHGERKKLENKAQTRNCIIASKVLPSDVQFSTRSVYYKPTSKSFYIMHILCVCVCYAKVSLHQCELNCVEVSVSSQCARGVRAREAGKHICVTGKLLIESNGHEREINSIPAPPRRCLYPQEGH
jgi:hypothetical protein